MLAHQLSLERSFSTGTKRSSTSVIVTAFQSIILRDSTSNSLSGVVPPETASVACPRSAMAALSLFAMDSESACASSDPLVKSCRSMLMPFLSNDMLQIFVFKHVFIPKPVSTFGRHAHSVSCQVRPSRSMSAMDDDGPQVPAV